MKLLQFAVYVALVFVPVESIIGQQTTLSGYKIIFDRELKPWTKTIDHFSLSSFHPTDTIAFEDLAYNDVKGLREFYSVYKPALTFSKDGNRFIDIYSYSMNLERKGNKIIYSGSEVDQAISLCDVKGKKWTRILFCGSSMRIQEVVWMDNNRFILVGSVENENSKFSPVVYVGNVAKSSFQLFTTTDPKCHQIGNYESSKLRRLNIQNQEPGEK